MAAVIERESRDSRSTFAKIVNDERNRSIFYQILVFGIIGWVGWYLFSNTSANLEARGMASGFDFLGTSAGFDIAWSIIPYEPTDNFGRVYLVGVTNTLMVSLLAIVLTTILGFIIGVLRLSHNWLISTIAAWYVEIFRNTPLLLQILFWYTAVFSVLPRPKQSIDVGGHGDFSAQQPWPVLSRAAAGRSVLAYHACHPGGDCHGLLSGYLGQAPATRHW